MDAVGRKGGSERIQETESLPKFEGKSVSVFGSGICKFPVLGSHYRRWPMRFAVSHRMCFTRLQSCPFGKARSVFKKQRSPFLAVCDQRSTRFGCEDLVSTILRRIDRSYQ